MGGRIYSPYSGETFSDRRQTDIEHIIARSEAHDSGLCAASLATKRAFAEDLLNLTLASPELNRNVKRAYDATEWLPALNQCWFADRVIKVRQKYSLSIDRAEANVLDKVLASCTSTKMLITKGVLVKPTNLAPPKSSSDPNDPVLKQYDDNKNGRITCKEARKHGIAPVPRSHPAYKFMRDGDNDGTVCE